MRKTKIVCLEGPQNFELTDEAQNEYEKIFLLAIYRTLYDMGKISFEQIKYLENLNRGYWKK